MLRVPVHACIDRALPIELWLQAGEIAIRENDRNAPAFNARSALPGVPSSPPRPLLAALTGKLWKPGRTIRVSFVDGDQQQHLRVAAFARQWSVYANIAFDFVPNSAGEIRVSFDGIGSWSYVGTDALSVPSPVPTMNLGWLNEDVADDEFGRVVLHEFGHALGCIHEHQNPSGGIPWDRIAVYEYYQGPPNYWSRQQIDTNIFRRYDRDMTQFSELDPESIMLYPIPNQLTIGDFEVGWNRQLSAVDRQYIAALYPRRETQIVNLEIDGAPVAAEIGVHGEVDLYSFTVESRSGVRVETEGSTDVSISLFGPDDNVEPIAQDDNSGSRTNARIVIDLSPGEYFVRVRHSSPSGLGEYRIGAHSAQ